METVLGMWSSPFVPLCSTVLGTCIVQIFVVEAYCVENVPLHCKHLKQFRLVEDDLRIRSLLPLVLVPIFILVNVGFVAC